jgi:hypothetical protein
MMKSFCLYIFALFLLSCQKEAPKPVEIIENQTTSNSDPNIGCTDVLATNYKATATSDDCSCKYDFVGRLSNNALTAFTQKILIEEHSGTWCGWCPLSKETLEKLAVNPNIVGVEIHYNDKLTLLDEVYLPLKNQYGYPAWPSGMVNRKKNVAGSTFIISEADWEKNTTDILTNSKPEVGIAIDTKIMGDEIQLMTKVKFSKSQGTEKYGLGIYLVEDKVEKFPQINYARGMSQFQKYKAYNLPSVIEDIKHYNVARGIIAPHIKGHEIPTSASDKLNYYDKLFKYKVTNKDIKLENCKIIAFVMNEKNEIQNVNYCDLGNKADWN